jgi:hypothetical protein
MNLNLGKSKSAALVTSAGALLVVVVSLISWIAGRTGVTDPRANVVTQTTVRTAAERQRVGYQALERALNGEVSTTAERIRDASALATAASVLIATELGKGRAPGSADQLISALLQKGLLPGFSPGATPGTLVTQHGTLAVRYRRTPIGIEVLSLGKNREAGQAILIRVPADGGLNDSAIWLAESLDQIAIPQPFAPAAQVMAAGWQPLPPIPTN